MGATDNSEETPESVVKYQKPKILLLDLPDEVQVALREQGYNVRSGSFGQPYRVPMDGKYQPLLAHGDLPNYTEQEIVFIDLLSKEATDSPEGEVHTSPDQYNWWVKQSVAEIDPRPRLMAMVQEAFDRILAHGGAFVVFAQSRHRNEYVWAKDHYGELIVQNTIEYDTWSFCSLLNPNNLRSSGDSGTEVQVEDGTNLLLDFARRHAQSMRYTASFHPEYRLSTDSSGFSFYPMFKSKYGGPVGGIILDPERKSRILILPQCTAKQKEYICSDLMTNVIPEMSPHLFPHLEGGRWVYSQPYEHPTVLTLGQQQHDVREAAAKQVERLEDQIASERTTLGYQHGILTKKGSALVADVQATLEQFGFANVANVDEIENEDDQPQEDLQILDRSPALLAEVKGLARFPTEADVLQVVKYVVRRMKEWGRTDVSGVVIINHQCNLPALERDDRKVFTEQQVKDAESQDITLVTTWELFRLIRGLQQWGWPSEAVQDLFYRAGRISVAPANYRHVGHVAHFYDDAHVVSIEVDDGESVSVGDTLGFILADSYVQEQATELQIDRNVVQQATGGQRVGHKTKLSRKQLPDKTPVYVVDSASTDRKAGQR